MFHFGSKKTIACVPTGRNHKSHNSLKKKKKAKLNPFMKRSECIINLLKWRELMGVNGTGT